MNTLKVLFTHVKYSSKGISSEVPFLFQLLTIHYNIGWCRKKVFAMGHG